MRVYKLLAATAIITTPLLLWGIPEADAAPPVRFSFAQYDSPGDDTGSNKSLNAEWIRVTNFSKTARELTGWKIRDRKDHVYTFPSFTLGAQRSVRIHTGSGSNTKKNLYWGEDYYVWNNTGDRAVLRRGNVKVDACSWKDADTEDTINGTKC